MKIRLPNLSGIQHFKKINQLKFNRLRKRKDLDDLMHLAHKDVFATIDCLECANCCKTTGPLFGQQDIERIARYLQLKPGRFIQEYLQMDEDGDFVLQTLPCTFLNHDHTCSIYDQRPRACRQYPHTQQKGQARIFELTLKNMEICPAVEAMVKKIL